MGGRIDRSQRQGSFEKRHGHFEIAIFQTRQRQIGQFLQLFDRALILRRDGHLNRPVFFQISHCCFLRRLKPRANHWLGIVCGLSGYAGFGFMRRTITSRLIELNVIE